MVSLAGGVLYTEEGGGGRGLRRGESLWKGLSSLGIGQRNEGGS